MVDHRPEPGPEPGPVSPTTSPAGGEQAVPSMVHYLDIARRLPKGETLGNALALAVDKVDFVLLGRYTDEELAALSGGVDRQTNPWLSMLRPELQSVAVAEGRLTLVAHGCAEFGHGEPIDAAGHVAAMLWARGQADGAAAIDVEMGGDIAARVLLYRPHPRLFLIELVGRLGLHEFSFANAGATGRWLVRQAGVTERVAEELLVHPGDGERLAAVIQQIRDRARRATRVLVHDGSGPREAEVFLDGDRAWLCEHANAIDGSIEVRLRSTGVEQLSAYLAHMIGPLG